MSINVLKGLPPTNLPSLSIIIYNYILINECILLMLAIKGQRENRLYVWDVDTCEGLLRWGVKGRGDNYK